MAKDITLMGASYSDVPSVVLPKTGGGTAEFVDPVELIDDTAGIGDTDKVYSADKVATMDASARESINDVVLVQSTEPTSEDNKIWIDDTNSPTGVQVPTYTELTAVQSALNALPTDVKINGESVVSENVANVPVASTNTLGVVRLNTNYGLFKNDDNQLYLIAPTDEEIKGGTKNYRAISPVKQHQAVFYGLAKCAGDSSQASSSNVVGEYTDDAKSAIRSMIGSADADFVGDTAIGSHVETAEKLAFTNSTVISKQVTIQKTTDNILKVNGTASGTFLETIQNNIALPAGNYTFTISSPIQSSGYQIQLLNIDADTVLQSFTSNATNQFYNFTINSAMNVRVRILVMTGSVVDDSQKVSLYSRTSVANTLSYSTAKMMEDVSFLTDKVKQKCGLIESVGTILTADKLTITGTNIKVRSDNGTLFSPTAKRITALADSATVKFAFGGVTYDFDTFTLVFYFPYDSYKSTSATSVELRIYGNGSANTPIVSTSNCCWGWNYLKLPKAKLGLSQNTKLSSVDIVFKTTSGTTETEFGEIIVDSILLDMKMKPTFILDLDQIWEKSIDNGAYDYCRAKNVPYTIHTWQFDNLNSAKVAEMKTAMKNGCEFSYYGGYTNENYMTNVTNYSDAIAECVLMENDIIPFTSRRFMTYGCGAHLMNPYLRESLEASGVKAIRGRWMQNPVGYFCDRSTWLPYSIEISYGNSTVAQIKAQIDEAITNGSCVVAFTHGVCDDDETVLGVSSSAIRITDFKEAIDYLANLRNNGLIQICTMEQFVNMCIG